MSETLDEFRRRAKSLGNAPALVEPAGALSYAELSAALDRGGLAARAGEVVPIDGSPAQVVIAALRARAADAVPALGSGPAPAAHELPAGCAFLRTTSGSTGAARWIAIGDREAARAALRSAAMMRLREGDVVVTTVPAITSYGWVAGLLGPLLAGATVVVAPAEAPREVLTLSRLHGAAWLVTTPPLVRAFARLIALDPASRPACRVLVAASAYPTEAAAQLLALGLLVVDRFGASETGPVAQAREPLGALQPAPGVWLRAEADGLEIRCDSVAIGEVGGRRFDGVFRSADLVDQDGSGGFRLRGRVDRVVRRAGRSVDLERLEATLRALPGVLGAHVDVRPGALDVDLVARVVPVDGVRLSPVELLARLNPTLEAWERPHSVEVVERAAMGPKW